MISGQTPGAAVSLTKAASRARARPKAAGRNRFCIELTLPLPPSANSLWRGAGKHVYRSTKYTKWLHDAGWLAATQTKERDLGRYKLSIDAVRPDKRTRDIDNLIKPVNDLLQHVGVVKNDSDCEMVSARWVTTGEGITVRIEPVGQE